MKIAHVSDCYLPRLGGIENHVFRLATAQLAAGHRVEVLTTTHGADAPVVDAASAFPVHRVRRSGSASGAPGYQSDPPSLEEYDAVHVHASVFSPFAATAVSAAVAVGVPVVVTLHSLLSWTTPLYAGLAALGGLSTWPVEWTAVSDVAADPLRRVVGTDRVRVLPNAVDAAAWASPRPATTPGAEPGLTVVAVMRLARRKRPLPLLRALRRARAALHPSVPLRAVVVGEGPSRPAMERYLRRHDMTDWVDLPGRMDGDHVREVLWTAGAFCAPATLESFGIAALEARSAGLPVIARSGCGVGDFITHGREGLLADDDEEMARAMVRLATEPGLRAKISEHNRTTPPTHDWAAAVRGCDLAYARAAVRAGAAAVRRGSHPLRGVDASVVHGSG